MVVEDEAIIAFGLEDAFQEEGFEVVGPFASCADALASLRSALPSLAIVDATLRDGPCLELARELRRREVPFLIYSGRDAFEEQPPELDGILWIDKPAPPDTLMRAARSLLCRRDEPSPHPKSASGTTSDPDVIAAEVLSTLDRRVQIPPISERYSGLDLASAYHVAAAVRLSRERRGECVVGRKIGFTNTTIWAEYGVGAPIWGYVYDTTLHNLADLDGRFDLSTMVEPRIEPEIMFGLARAPEAGMDERALLACVEWVAHGFEIVQSIFPDWRFTAADTVAGFGLHGALLVGPKVALRPDTAGEWCDALASFKITLTRAGKAADHGRASNVLHGGPLTALRHLVEVLADDESSPALAAGEVVSTGTLTRALPITAGETWSAELDGIPLPGATIRFS